LLPAQVVQTGKVLHNSLYVNDIEQEAVIAMTNFTNEHTGQLLVGRNALWPTQTKFWVGHGPVLATALQQPHDW